MAEEENDKKTNNKYIINIVVAVVFLGLGFFVGMKFQESKHPEFMRNIPEEFRDRMGDRQFGDRNGNMGLRPVNGEILDKSDDSITVKLSDDSSKIILITEDSSINKTEEGSIDDLSEGESIVVFGEENSDGSITAQNIQIGTRILREAGTQDN
ncbi:hypothetical protein JXA63_00610 [Candidatus Woesebacteria bacterium]|nr:hypothetical protein [Candidatus Woesebacteria bacterium]